MCAHCKHRRMTVNDLTDAIYSAYCDELSEYLLTGSKLYAPIQPIRGEAAINDAATRAKKFLFRALSVVGEQAILPRYNQFILRLESFSTAALSDQNNEEKSLSGLQKAYVSSFRQTVKQRMKERGFEGEVVKIHNNNNTSNEAPKIGAVATSAALKASKEFLQSVKKLNDAKDSSPDSQDDEADEINGWAQAEFEGMGPYSWKRDFLFDAEYLRKLACLSRGPQYMRDRYGEEADVLFGSDSEDGDCEPDEEGMNRGPRGAIMSEDDEELIDAETDLPIDEAELVLPGGAACPLLPPGESEGVAQWSEASRIECGRTVFLMFASEMFQYRLSAAYLDSLAKEKQQELLREVEEEERRERAEQEKRLAVERKSKEAKKKKKKGPVLSKQAKSKSKESIKAQKEKEEEKEESSSASEAEAESESEPVEVSVKVPVEPIEPVNVPVEPVEIITTSTTIIEPVSVLFNSNPSATVTPAESDDDFDPLSLIDELSKEMNRFEMSRTEGTTESMVTDAPPGFTPTTKSAQSYEHPPFSFQLQDDGPPGMLFPHVPPPPPPPMQSRFSSFFSNSVFGPSNTFFTSHK